LLARHRDVWLLVQNHLKRDPAARLTIAWVRHCFRELGREADRLGRTYRN
jgi:hypothetical protein